MGHRLQYDHTTITGYATDEKGRLHKKATDDFIHLRHQDPILMAKYFTVSSTSAAMQNDVVSAYSSDPFGYCGRNRLSNISR